MGKAESREFLREYNRSCGGILKRERLKRNISREKLGQGIINEIGLGNIEEVLEPRQRISTLIGFREWEKAEKELEKFRRKVDPEYPRVRQELLRLDAIIQWKRSKGNNAYFERNGGYGYARDFFGEAYRLAVKEAGGEDEGVHGDGAAVPGGDACRPGIAEGVAGTEARTKEGI